MRNFHKIKTIYFIVFINFVLLFSSFTHADSKPSAETINVGISAALSGPSQDLGQAVKMGIQAYFDEVNAAKGINDKKLVLIALDDQYEPNLAAANMHQLIEKYNVIAVIGNVGTPTAVLTVPIANDKKILLLGAYSGGDILRKNPPDRYVINLRASYAEETETMVKGLISIGIKPEEIAFFIQNDAYGESGYQGAMKALKAAGYAHPELLPVGKYTRNTLNVEEGLQQIVKSGKSPKAIIMVGTYGPNAKFIMLAKKEFPHALFLNVSFVGTHALTRQLGKNTDNVIITQVVPYFDSNLEAVRGYRKDLQTYFPGVQPGFGSFEGYLVAKLCVEGLKAAAASNNLTREGLVNAFENMRDIDIGMNEKISFDKNHHQALHTVWPSIFIDGLLRPLENWSILTEGKK